MIRETLRSTRLEFLKSKRKPTFLLILAVILINLAYLFIGIKKNDISGIPQPWEAILFYLPLINSLFLSVLMAVIASQCVDLEHRGCTWNLLQSLQSKNSLYIGKVLYGFIWLLVFSILEMLMTVLMAKYLGFPGLPSAYGTIFTLVGEMIGGMVVFQLQMILSLLFENQFAALAISLCGTLAGFFLMYVDDRIITPWSIMGALRVLNMDYNKGDAFASYTYYYAPFGFRFAACLYFIAALLTGLWLYHAMEEGTLPGLMRKEKATKSVHSYLPAELIKLKHSPVWIAFVVMPVISALIGVFNFMVNRGTLGFKWSDLWTQQSLFLGIFFLSPLIAICCSLLCRMEHTGNNWNNVLTLEPPAKIVKDKLLIASGISLLCVVWIGILFVLSGSIIGLEDAIPEEFYESMLCGAFACIAVSSLQIFLSLIIKSFAIPVGIAIAGGLGGLMLLSKGLGYALPYAMLQKGLRSTNLTGDLNIPSFIAVSIAYTILFYLLSVISCRHAAEKG